MIFAVDAWRFKRKKYSIKVKVEESTVNSLSTLLVFSGISVVAERLANGGDFWSVNGNLGNNIICLVYWVIVEFFAENA